LITERSTSAFTLGTGIGMIRRLRQSPLGSVGLPAGHPAVLHSSRAGPTADAK